MVDTMRKGADMVIKSVSTHGTKTTDTYSLKGISEALDKVADGVQVAKPSSPGRRLKLSDRLNKRSRPAIAALAVAFVLGPATMTSAIDTDTIALAPAPFVEKTPLERYVAPDKPSLIGLSRARTRRALGTIGVPEAQRKMRVQQLWHWIYFRGLHLVRRHDQRVEGTARGARRAFHAGAARSRGRAGLGRRHAQMAAAAAGRTAIASVPHEVECVYIPDTDRGTLCVSSQVGCTLTCTFCHTGTQRLVRNLTAGEIVGQVMVARDRLGDWPGAHAADRRRRSEPATRCVTNIVMMGMGEPLYNFEAVRDALLIVADGDGIAISKRRITLSTSGVVPMIERAGAEIGCMLAVSLHAVRDDLRNELVPLNRKYPIAELLEACRNYPGVSNAKRITFEYVMLKGVNDSIDDAKALVRLLKGIPAKINLIPFNPWPGSRYECSDWEQIEKFSQVVFDAGYASPVRTPRGRDILAACGQLKSASEKLSARERMALRAMAMTD